MAGYYVRIPGSPALLSANEYLVQAIRDSRAAGDEATALKITVALAELDIGARELAQRVATKADELVRLELDSRRVRPRRPAGHSGNLGAHVLSRALPTAFPYGAVGIADLAELDKTVNPDYPGSTYWRSIEYGLSKGFVGRAVYGRFQPGDSAPSSALFRVHPYFDHEGKGKGVPRMLIRRPIRPKRFLERGSDNAYAYYQLQVRLLSRKIIRLL